MCLLESNLRTAHFAPWGQFAQDGGFWRPILATGIDNPGIDNQRKAATNYKSTG
jgi:hypothetical protein